MMFADQWVWAVECREMRDEGRSQRMKTGLRSTFLPVLIAALAASGCTSTSAGRLGGGSAARGSGIYISALQGGLIGRNSAADLSRGDLQRALEAEYRALEAAPGGQPVTWQGSGVAGSVVAAAPYQVGSQNCRQYSHKVSIDGRETESRGAACRNEDGTWTPLS